MILTGIPLLLVAVLTVLLPALLWAVGGMAIDLNAILGAAALVLLAVGAGSLAVLNSSEASDRTSE